MIRSQCSVPFAVETDPAKLRPVDVPVIAADITALQADTGWSPQIPLAQTVSDMLESARRLLKEQSQA